MEPYPKPETFGDYLIHARIAQGGMADVLLATSIKPELHGQFIAIKKLLPHLNSNKAFVNLLIHEAKVGVLLNHPGIAQVYDLGSHKAEFFISMEYVHGKSLDRILEKIKEKKAPKLPLELATFVVLETLKSLSFAHQLSDSKGRELNIIHRDVSPGNILLSYRGDVKLADFGIATAAGRLQAGFTQSAMGKLAYMAPEQAVNDPVVRASDLYSLSVVYFELLTGQLPFQAENPNTLLKKVIDGRMTDIKMLGPTIPQELRDLITHCLNKSSRKRFQSGPEFHAALTEFFHQNHEIDFTSKATREYYRKKLSEYLRAVFEPEIIQEIETVQSALESGPEIEELKKTAPQFISQNIDKDFDATVFEQDVSDEATRHYPLTENERQNLLKGLPAKRAIQMHSAEAFDQATRAMVAVNEAEGGMFSSATIPDFDLSSESSAMRRISVKDKLAKSSLSRDEKETLKQQMPAMEIVSLQDLDAFEKTTFGGPQRAEDSPTRPHNRNEILSDFEKIKKRERQSEPKSKWHPISIIQKIKKAPEEIAQEEAQQQEVARSSRPSQKKPAVSQSRPADQPRGPWGLILSIVIMGAVLGSTFHYREKLSHFVQSTFVKSELRPTQSIFLSIMGEAQPDQQREIRQTIAQEGVQSLTDFFNKEYTRYTGNLEPVLQFKASDPGVLISGLSKQENAARLMSTSKIFSFLDQVGFVRPSDESTIIYVYLFPYDPAQPSDLTFPREYRGERPKKRGVIFAPAHESHAFMSMIYLARQIAFAFGATDKRDPNSGLPLNPEGLADPKRSPIYPQEKAELMAIEIAVSPLQKRMPADFKEIVIGPKTAKELGWISSDQLRSLMP